MSAEGIKLLRQAAVADKDTWFSIHHRVTFTDGRLPIFPGNAHQKIRTAIDDAAYWAQRGNDVYLAQGMFRNSGAHRPGMPYSKRAPTGAEPCRLQESLHGPRC